MPADLVSRHLTIRGTVQGVGFRFRMAAEAERLGITGWVRNRSDGSVEAVVQGPADAVSAIVAWAHRGPPQAKVTAVAVTAASAEPFAVFDCRPTT